MTPASERPALPRREAWQSQHPKDRRRQHQGEGDVVELHLDATGQRHGGHPADKGRAHQRGAEEQRSTHLGSPDEQLDHRDAERADGHERHSEQHQRRS